MPDLFTVYPVAVTVRIGRGCIDVSEGAPGLEAWVYENAGTLTDDLGVGEHHGEWWPAWPQFALTAPATRGPFYTPGLVAA